MKFANNGSQENQAVYGKSLHGMNLIGGEEYDASDGERFDSFNPADAEDRLGSFPHSTREDVRRAIDAARQALPAWKNTPAPVRANFIGRIGRLLEEHKASISYLVTREMGKTLKEAGGSVQEAIDTCAFFQSEGRRLYGQTVPSEMRHKELMTYRRPRGVVGVITPSNFPIAVASWKIIPAILCGNTVVWKSPPEAPAVAYVFSALMQAAGLPPGVVNLVHGGGATTGQHLVDAVDDGLIDKISFTGSTAIGRMIGEVCGRNLITPSLELGGKNPLIVMDDANLELAVEGALWSAFGTGGQRCTSAGNIIVHKKIYKRFRKQFMAGVESITIGNPLLHKEVLYGPMICNRYLENFLDHYRWAAADGSQKIYGEGRITKENKPAGFQGEPSNGYFAWPTVWEGVVPNTRLATDEVFGPTVNLIEVNDLDEALKVANAPNYGLSSAIYTERRSAVVRFKNEIEAGMSSINNSTVGAEAHLPFGGIKGSGNGSRESGIWVIEAYTYWHAVNDDCSGGLQLAQMDTEGLDPQSPQEFRLNEILPAKD